MLRAVVFTGRHAARKHVTAVQRRTFEKVAWNDVQRAQAAGEGRFIDVRSADLFRSARAEGFVNVPLSELASKLSSSARDERVTLIDNYGFHAEKGARALEAAGFTSVRVVDGGLLTWAFRGAPLASDDASLAPKLRTSTEKPTLASVEANAADLGVTVDLKDEVFPLLDVHMKDPADREEALSKSYVCRK